MCCLGLPFLTLRLAPLPDLLTLGKSSLQTGVMLFRELLSLYGKTEQREPDALQGIPLEHGSQAGFDVGLQAVRCEITS